MLAETGSYVLVWNMSPPAIAFSVTSECISPMRLMIPAAIIVFLLKPKQYEVASFRNSVVGRKRA